MRPSVILLMGLFIVSAGVLVAGCTSPSGNVTQPTAPPTGTETPSVTATTTTTANVTTAATTGAAANVTTAANATTGASTGAGGQATTVDLTAQNIKFDKSTITVPAGAKVTVNFNNKDSGVTHNFAVYTDSSASQKIFVGDVITGPATTTYTFTAPSTPDTYFFRCDVHPQQMNGDFVVQ